MAENDSSMRKRRSPLAAKCGGIAVILAMLLTSCSSSVSTTDNESQGYISNDGTVAEWAPDQRGEPIDFVGTIENGDTITSDDYTGQVLVVNFWYASCPPCRAEAPDLQALNAQYADEGVSFLGINVRDEADTAIAFSRTFDITYPSIIDTRGKTSLAFAGKFAANAVPTTLVLDKTGRPAARILGQLASRSILDTLIAETLAEEVP
jgi:thiol-disulfide isomerase/thioredoxin